MGEKENKSQIIQMGPGLNLEIEDAEPDLFNQGGIRPSKVVEGGSRPSTTIQGKRVYLEDLHGK
jgi:hypothetical protein